jgi:hypothetical protein
MIWQESNCHNVLQQDPPKSKRHEATSFSMIPRNTNWKFFTLFTSTPVGTNLDVNCCLIDDFQISSKTRFRNFRSRQGHHMLDILSNLQPRRQSPTRQKGRLKLNGFYVCSGILISATNSFVNSKFRIKGKRDALLFNL